jgi:DNA (cytosine-5)-methyltransferase 1
MSYTMGSLFAGIGGFDLGFERAGFKTVWQVEIDPYCQKVLAKNFPEAERFGDVRECGSHNLKPVDVICGGFPCQDISNAGKRAGIEGERSGLWGEYARIISELRPKFVLVENVAALLGRGMGRVLGDLAEIGYDGEWEIISAADVGAPHLRERVWIMAYPKHSERRQDASSRRRVAWQNPLPQGQEGSGRFESCSEELAYPPSERCGEEGELRCNESAQRSAGRGEEVADTDNPRLEGWDGDELRQRAREWLAGQGCSCAVADASEQRRNRWLHWSCGWEREPEEALHDARGGGREEAWMSIPESLLGRVANGVPARVDRLRGLGNAVVPQIPEMIAHRIRKALEVAA